MNGMSESGNNWDWIWAELDRQRQEDERKEANKKRREAEEEERKRKLGEKKQRKAEQDKRKGILGSKEREGKDPFGSLLNQTSGDESPQKGKLRRNYVPGERSKGRPDPTRNSGGVSNPHE